MRNRLLSLLSVGALFAVLSGCATPPGEGGDSAPDASSPVPDASAPATPGAEVDLIDLWRVGGVEGESENTWLRLEAREFQLWRDCGIISGSWRVRGDLLLAGVYSASGGCATASVPEVPWIDAVAGYTATADGFDLVDGEGATVASLTIDGAPEPRADLAASYAEPPEVTDEVREELADPAPIPDALVPIGRDELVGRWAPTGPAGATEAHVEFTDNGRWTGSDGCNGGAGRWASGAEGIFLATIGASTLIGCDGAAVPAWIANTTTAGLDVDELVLVGSDGAELGRLVRA